MSKPWELKETPWKTEAAFWSYVRGGLRKALWNRNPIKLSYMRSVRFKAPLGRENKNNPEGLVWAYRCEHCGETFKQTKVEVDHKTGVGSLKGLGDISSFVERLTMVSHKDLRILDKRCHRIFSYADRMNISFEEAELRKEIIDLKKGGVSPVKKFLLSEGFITEEITNEANRKLCFEVYIKDELKRRSN